jgi:hypothetical protein
VMALACTQPRLEAALSDGPLATPCPHGHDLVFAPGWFCEDCRACVFPDMVRGDDDEPDADYS